LIQFSHVTTANGIYSASDKRVHFGLGAEDSIKELEIQWPSGTTQKLRDIKTDQLLKIVESQN
jgi:hypothetical protein